MTLLPEINRLKRLSELRVESSFKGFIQNLRISTNINDIAILIDQNRPMDILANMESRFNSFLSEVDDVFVQSGRFAARNISRSFNINVDIGFDSTTSSANRLLVNARARLFREFLKGQEQLIRSVIIRSNSLGLSSGAIAIEIRDSVGLTSTQMKSMGNFRGLLERNAVDALSRQLRDIQLDGNLRKIVELGNPLTGTQIRRMVQRYGEGLIGFRSRVIAQTEVLRSVHQGIDQMFSQAINFGLVNSDDVVRTWITSGDESVRGSHKSMNGQIQLMGSPFASGAGNLLQFPGDPSVSAKEIIGCRCAVTTEIIKGISL